jgi:hypothetical protein
VRWIVDDRQRADRNDDGEVGPMRKTATHSSSRFPAWVMWYSNSDGSYSPSI